jgi:hypothetical protein
MIIDDKHLLQLLHTLTKALFKLQLLNRKAVETIHIEEICTIYFAKLLLLYTILILTY